VPRVFLLNGDSESLGAAPTDKSIYAVSSTGTADTSPPVVSNAQIKYGAAAIYCAGPSGLRTYAHHANFNWGTGDFTVQSWIYCLGGSTGCFGKRNNGSNANGSWVLFVAFAGTSNNPAWLELNSSGVAATYNFNMACPVSQWAHIAVCRASGTLRGYINGIKKFETASSFDYTSTSSEPVIIGSNITGNSPYFGGFDDIAFSNFAEYGASDFTPPTQLTAYYAY
jgi:hypothetical protein